MATGQEADGPAAKRPRRAAGRQDDPRAERIKKLVVVVGQGAVRGAAGAAALQKQLLGLRQVLAMDVEDDEYGEIVRGALLECACSFGWKAPVYGALVALLPPVVQAAIVVDLRDRLAGALAEAAGPGAWQAAVVLRFYCELANCQVLALDDLVAGLATLVEAGLVGPVMRALPWLASARAGTQGDLVAKLDAAVKGSRADLAAEWNAARALLQGFQGGSAQDETNNAQAAAELFPAPYEIEAITQAFARNKTEDGAEPPAPISLDSDLFTVSRPDSATEDLHLHLFRDAGAAFVAHLDKRRESGKTPPFAQAEEKSGLEQAAEKVASCAPEAKWVWSLYIREILAAYCPFPKEAGEALLEFADGGAMDHVIVEQLLNVLLGEPIASMQVAFVQRLLLQLADAHPRIELVLEDAADAIMLLAPSIPAPRRDALADWFAFHISARGGRWPWAKWEQLAAKPADDVRRAWLVQVLEHLACLANVESYRSLVSAPIWPMFPPARTIRSPFIAEHGGAAPTPAGAKQTLPEAAKFVRTKPTPEELTEWVGEHLAEMEPDTKLTFLVHLALEVGQASLTHTSKAFERLRKVLDQELGSDRAQKEVAVARAVLHFWGSDRSWAGVVLTHLVFFAHVSSLAVCECLCEPANLEHWQTYPVLAALLECPLPLETSESQPAPLAGAFGTPAVAAKDGAKPAPPDADEEARASARDALLEKLAVAVSGLDSTDATARLANLLAHFK